jgi:hypothetical protein
MERACEVALEPRPEGKPHRGSYSGARNLVEVRTNVVELPEYGRQKYVWTVGPHAARGGSAP